MPVFSLPAGEAAHKLGSAPEHALCEWFPQVVCESFPYGQSLWVTFIHCFFAVTPLPPSSQSLRKRLSLVGENVTPGRGQNPPQAEVTAWETDMKTDTGLGGQQGTGQGRLEAGEWLSGLNRWAVMLVALCDRHNPGEGKLRDTSHSTSLLRILTCFLVRGPCHLHLCPQKWTSQIMLIK